MAEQDPRFIRRRALDELLRRVSDPNVNRVMLLGETGSGKTTLLRMLERKLRLQGRAVFFIGLHGLRDPGELGSRVLDAVEASSIRGTMRLPRTLRTSAGAPALRDAARVLRGAHLMAPVLLLDGLDDSLEPSRMAAAVEELALLLEDWGIVVSSRTTLAAALPRLARFQLVQLNGIDRAAAAEFLANRVTGLPAGDAARMAELAGGSPLHLQLLRRQLEQSGVTSFGSAGENLHDVIERILDSVISGSSDPAAVTKLLELIALAGGRAAVLNLAKQIGRPQAELERLLGDAKGLVVTDGTTETVALLHDAVAQAILARLVSRTAFRLTDLNFGAEEAERDKMLDRSFVPRHDQETLLQQRKSLVVGDRGSGKSALFRRLAMGPQVGGDGARLEVYPVSDSGDLLHRLVTNEAWLDPEALRAAWLVVVAASIASACPPSATKQLRDAAADLRGLLGMSSPEATPLRRAFRALVRPLRGTTLRLAVGPVNLEAELPSGSGKTNSKASVDVEDFLRQLDYLLQQDRRRVVMTLDRVDETFKYDRRKQEAVVQALMQAESRVSQFECISLVAFLRRDLFELYDIQEKNKLVSRMLTLTWSEEEWLEVLGRRVLANESLAHIGEAVRQSDGQYDTRAALAVIFPLEMEGQPTDRWLVDELRNGNGDISPRLAVLLLHLTRDLSARSEDVVRTLPLFTANALSRAMTKLSELSYSEVVNDFKVASGFVMNCRAAKLDSFTLDEVIGLFDEADGPLSEQVRTLERLGFLERVIETAGAGLKSLFRVPRLYTRCW